MFGLKIMFTEIGQCICRIALIVAAITRYFSVGLTPDRGSIKVRVSGKGSFAASIGQWVMKRNIHSSAMIRPGALKFYILHFNL